MTKKSPPPKPPAPQAELPADELHDYVFPEQMPAIPMLIPRFQAPRNLPACPTTQRDSKCLHTEVTTPDVPNLAKGKGPLING